MAQNNERLFCAKWVKKGIWRRITIFLSINIVRYVIWLNRFRNEYKKCSEIWRSAVKSMKKLKVHRILSLQKQENVMKQSKTLGILWQSRAFLPHFRFICLILISNEADKFIFGHILPRPTSPPFAQTSVSAPSNEH